MSNTDEGGEIIPLAQERKKRFKIETLVASGTELDVIRDIEARQQHGINKYGQTVADNPLNLLQWLQHGYEEHLDAAVYLKRAIQEIGASQSFKITGIRHLSGEVLLTTDCESTVSERIAAGDTVVLLVLKKGA